MIDEASVERICMDAVDLFLSTKLRKMKRRVTLEEVTSWIESRVIEDTDATLIIREMRDRQYGY